MTWWWSWLLCSWAVAGLLVIGNRKPVGWIISFTSEFAWGAYAVSSRQYGFLVMSVIFAVVHARNWRKWKKEVPGG